MIGFLIGTAALATLIFAIIQLSFLWAGQGAVETAAHFAARKFAINARMDLRKAKTAALAEASLLCRNRPGGTWETAALTSLDFAKDGSKAGSPGAAQGDAYMIRLTHGVELVVPWVNRLLFALAPVRKAKIGSRYYFLLNTTRWTTVE